MTPAIPKTYRDMLAIVADADIFSWHREAKTVSLTFDDLPADRRTCLSLYMASAGKGMIEVRTLDGYEPDKHRWSNYCSPSGTIILPDLRGRIALLSWIAAQAEKVTGWRNPETFSIHKACAVA